MKKQRVKKFSGQGDSLVRSIFPAQIRTFAGTLAGNREPITEKDFTEAELKQARDAIMQSRERQANRTYIQDPNTKKMVRAVDTPNFKYDQTVGYTDYGTETGSRGQKSILRDYGVGSGDAMRNTLGRFSYEKTPEGRLVATDNYDFKDDLAREIPGIKRTADYEAMGPLEKVGALVADTVKGGAQGVGSLPSRVGNAYIGRNGRPVRIDLGEAPFKKGGAVKAKANGTTKAKKVRGCGIAQRGLTKGKIR